jgi:hypothetical protein
MDGRFIFGFLTVLADVRGVKEDPRKSHIIHHPPTDRGLFFPFQCHQIWRGMTIKELVG